MLAFLNTRPDWQGNLVKKSISVLYSTPHEGKISMLTILSMGFAESCSEIRNHPGLLVAEAAKQTKKGLGYYHLVSWPQ